MLNTLYDVVITTIKENIYFIVYIIISLASAYVGYAVGGIVFAAVWFWAVPIAVYCYVNKDLPF